MLQLRGGGEGYPGRLMRMWMVNAGVDGEHIYFLQ